ncbi:hypothetical protein HDU86_005016 [Geranomyces michiganensis]|nr:hypothetical protein HDU86_005016 [Geranomyces michiganensis]
MDKLREIKEFSSFVEALEKEKGLRDDLSDPGREATVFAPTNDAWRRAKEEWRSQGKEFEMRDVLRLHIAPESKITSDCLHPGALIPTSLRLKSLDDRHQRVRVFKFAQRIWLNMQSSIVGEEIKASGGIIHRVDGVLCPPTNAFEMMSAFPTLFSTSALAFEKTGMKSELSREKGLTVFLPDNNAWKSLGFTNLKYLFMTCSEKEGRRSSDRSSECRGNKELKKIVSNMVGTDLAYSTDIMSKQSMTFETLGGGKIEVCAKERKGQHERGSGEKHQNVNHYNFVINHGDALVKFTDMLSCNAAIHIVTRPLVPEGVHLPDGDRMMSIE